MNNRKASETLAQRAYVSFTFRDETTEGEPIYVALNPELSGCLAQGETMREALSNLDLVRCEYIEHLLENGLPVPAPAWNIDTGEEQTAIPREYRVVSLPQTSSISQQDAVSNEQPSLRLAHL